MADTFDVVVQVYNDVSGELKGDANVKTSAGMTYFSDGESLQEKVDSGEFTSGEQGPEGPPGPNSADLISVVDTEGLLGTPGTVVMSQNLFDAIVDSVANKLLPYARLANNGLTTEEGFALDARYGKTLKELFDSVNSNLSNLDAIVGGCFRYRKTITKTENIFALPAGTYTLLEGSNYLPATVGNYGVLLIMPAEYNYVTALYIDSSASVSFCFCDLGVGTWKWTTLPHPA